jgi:O-antigen ligase
VLLSGDRMGLLIMLATPILIGLLAPRLRKPMGIALPAVAALLGLILYFSPTMYHRQIDTTAETIAHLDQSPYGIVFKSGLEIARDRPIFGVGIHNYQAACLEPQYGPEKVGAEQTPRCLGHPHNAYLQWLAESGLVGLGLYLAFVVLSLVKLIRWMPANRDNLIFYALAASLALRFWPLAAGTSFFSSWSAEPLFLILGWSLAYCEPGRGVAEPAGLSRPVAHVSHASSVGV